MNTIIANESIKKDTFKIGITGDTNTKYFQLGMSALKTFDSSRFSIEMVELPEEKAKKALEKGEISAYAVIPEDFIENALNGEVETVKYVTTAGSQGLVSIFKTEITKVITTLVAESQKGVYGVAEALDSEGFENISNKKMNQLNIQYIDLILNRSKLYSREILDISNGLSLPQYYFGCLIIIFLLLECLPFATVFIKRDYSLNKLLTSKSFTPFSQVTCEYLAYTLSLLLIMLFLTTAIIGGGIALDIFKIASLKNIDFLTISISIVAVTFLISSLTIFIFEISNDLISGILIQFFVSIFLCFISGCIYPIYSLPRIIQIISRYSPISIARLLFQNAISGEYINTNLIIVLGITLVFFLLTVYIRKYKITRNAGVN